MNDTQYESFTDRAKDLGIRIIEKSQSRDDGVGNDGDETGDR